MAVHPVPAQKADIPGRKVGGLAVIVSGLLLLFIGVVLIQSLVELWPAVDGATVTQPNGGRAPDQSVGLFFAAIRFQTAASTSLIILAFVAGGLGAFVYVATSFATYVGNGQLLWRWILWYPVRLFIGSMLGAIFYFLVRGGFFSSSSLTTDINPYGIAGIAALVGMLSKQAVDKLTNLFESLFGLKQSAGDEDRANKARARG